METLDLVEKADFEGAFTLSFKRRPAAFEDSTRRR